MAGRAHAHCNGLEGAGATTIATGPTFIATGIAIIGVVPTLIATDGVRGPGRETTGLLPG